MARLPALFRQPRSGHHAIGLPGCGCQPTEPLSTSSEFVKFAAALFAILDPFGNTAIFLSITAERSSAERQKIAVMTSAAVLITLLVAAVIGRDILALFGISIGAFRIAGGIIVLLIALSMLRPRRSAVHQSAKEEADAEQKDNPAIFPLAIPVIDRADQTSESAQNRPDERSGATPKPPFAASSAWPD